MLAVCLTVIFVANYTNNYIRNHTALDYSAAIFVKMENNNTASFIVDGEEERISLLAINVIYKSDYVEKLLNNSNKIKLEYEQNAYTDKNGDICAYVFADDVLIQEELLKKGLADMKCKCNGYRYFKRMALAQTYAKDNKIGMWEETK